MKKLYYLLLLVLTLACDDEKALVFENQELNGVTYLKDPMLETGAVLAPKLDVYLYDGDTTKNFLQKTTGDDKGKFRFIFQPRQKDRIRVVSEFRDSASLLYRASANADGFKDSLILRPQYNMGLIKVKTNDVNGAPLVGMNVYVFTNPSLAAAARTGTPIGAIRTMKSNERAIAFFHGLGQDNYYVVGKKDSVTATLVDTVVVSASPAYKSTAKGKDLTLQQPLEMRIYEAPVLYTVSVKSKNDQALAGIDVYIFSSLAQAKSVLAEATNFIMKQRTGSNGKAEFRRLPTGDFYLAANGKFMGPDSLIVKYAIHPNPISFPIKTPSTDTKSRNLDLTIVTDD
ncbi:hypothetical protein [Dyadobacter sp. CY326]|uniref:hypothetical protein n=1 Tax=Dyadobacter sp. CY326 TaxID=2907300 RepID=UPI001F4339AC|nr:hypothetical protein [Dyadobacter sp. CY326]MCE7066661.1 hypothetical protein [Dyadobacter sp. CY326]